ncbi:hypothetical protein [Verrucomicrobium sp. BvORR106]|uniref:hypothetical protein n=1 Tax=Verrucomicrobium sp. BvORR106 TaxID=1403819 RepID=UPI002240ED7A|nr:hypothetical protein [Verrucomicrobium sp. BvORR106]
MEVNTPNSRTGKRVFHLLGCMLPGSLASINMEAKIAILVPDGAYPLVIEKILRERRASLRLRAVDYEIVKDAFRDSSKEVVDLLRPYQRSCSHVLLVRDFHGSGWEDRGKANLEKYLHNELIESGWEEAKSCVLIVDPEIEAWIRFESTHLQALVRERARKCKDRVDLFFPSAVESAIDSFGGRNELGKPKHPKEALETLLKEFGIQRSNSIYERLVEKESLHGCKVESFLQFIQTLQRWFPLNNGGEYLFACE